MNDVLSRIIKQKMQDIAGARAREPLTEIKARAVDAPSPRDFFSSVLRPQKRLRVIAEIKRASPSAGLIREDFDPVVIARAYDENGAAAISCLTDESFFQGDLSYIEQIREAVPLPVLRKDFIIDPYQVYEARAAGADAVLLIAECLDPARLTELLEVAAGLDMTTLLEVYEAENLQAVQPHLRDARSDRILLGINNRNLRTMTTDIAHTLHLLDSVDDRELLVSESGIRTHADAHCLMNAGVHRILVGEHLMRQRDVGKALRDLIHGESS